MGISNRLDLSKAFCLTLIVFVQPLLLNDSKAEPKLPMEVASYLEKISTINSMAQDAQEKPHKALLEEIEGYLAKNEDRAEAWIVTAISRASYARTQGMSALGMMKDVRDELEKAIEMDPKAMKGYAQSFLGRLYAMLPGWPISFGSEKKAKHYIEVSLATSESSMENQYSYGMYWLQEKDYDMARNYLQAAKTATPLVASENWVANMQQQIDEALAVVAAKNK